MAVAQRQILDIKLKGLYTAPNNLSAVPQGSFEIANNVVINAIDLVESRRGQTQYGSPVSIGSGQINKLFNYATALIMSYDDKMSYDSGNGAWINYAGTYEPPSSDFKIRSLEALRNFYFTTDEGIFKLDGLTSTPKKSGVVKALSGTYTLTGSSGFLVADSAVAYRIVWGYVDANNNLILGAPSQRLVVSNATADDVDVVLTYNIPATITTEYFYQIYRSLGTATATDEPTDELQLVIQGNPTAGEIAAKAFTVTDITPYSLMRQTLYTSPSLEGISQANNEPPFAIDMDIFKGYAFYANIRQKQTLSLAIISVDSPSFGYLTDATVDTTNGDATLTSLTSTADLRVGMRIIGAGIPVDTYILSITNATTLEMTKNATATATVSVEFQDRFTIANVDYFGGSANDVATNTFEVYTGGTPGQNINETALNLIQIINTSASNTTIYAYYISALDDLPGQILFEERSIGGSSFIATSTAGSSFSPTLPDENPITGISVANPTVITSPNHGLVSGTTIVIYGSNSTPTVDGERVVTVLNANTFTVPVNVTVIGTTGYWIKRDDLIESDNDAQQNRVAISKNTQVEAVPALQFVNIGSANFGIQRVIALRDGIFFFKQDGIFRLSGETIENFVVTLIDNTTVLLCAESAVAFNNQIFCFTNQGICAVSDTGVELKSVPIENVLLVLSSEQFSHFATASFGVAYESARQYMFFTVSQMEDTFATQAFIYNSLTDTWTRWIMERTCGIVGTTVNKLFMAKADTGQVLIERKNYTNDDYADEQYAVTINSVDSLTQLTLASATNVAVQMTIVQGFRSAIITAVNGNVITLDAPTTFSTGAAIVYTPIADKVKFNPIDCENPGILKQFCEVSLFFKNAAFTEIEATFSSNISAGTKTVTIENNSNYGWGQQNWGEFPWGGTLGGSAVLRTYVTKEQMRAHWLGLTLETEEAFTGFSLQGLSLMFNAMGPRIK